MPDGDKVHTNLLGDYQKPYKEICENESDERVVRTLLNSLKKTNKKYYRDEPILLIKQFSEYITAGDWRISPQDLNDFLNKQHRRLGGDGRAMNQAVSACKYVFQQIGNENRRENIYTETIVKYLSVICERDFFDKVPMQINHHNNATHDSVNERLEQMRPLLDENLKKMAGRIANDNSVGKISIQGAPKPKKLAMSDSLV